MKTKRVGVTMIAALILFVGGYGVRVLAEGAPSQQPLFYSGTLEADGQLASGAHTVTLELYNAETDGDELCTIERDAEVQAGRFRIDASECADAMRANADVWVVVAFRGPDGVERSIPGRSKVGAVPYALEADHAKSATAASGALEATIAQLSDRVAALEGGTPASSNSAFQAVKRTQQGLSASGTFLVFDDEIFDLNDEYDDATGIFSPKAAGRYEFFCSVAWAIGSHDEVATYEAAIQLNGSEYMYNGQYGDGIATTRQVHAVIELTPGDEVQCSSLQENGSLQLNLNAGYTSFEGRRFSL